MQARIYPHTTRYVVIRWCVPRDGWLVVAIVLHDAGVPQLTQIEARMLSSVRPLRQHVRVRGEASEQNGARHSSLRAHTIRFDEPGADELGR